MYTLKLLCVHNLEVTVYYTVKPPKSEHQGQRTILKANIID